MAALNFPTSPIDGQVYGNYIYSTADTTWRRIGSALTGSEYSDLVTHLWAKTGANKLINGNFRINQRVYVSTTSLASGVYCFDRWKAFNAGTTLTFTAAPQGQTVTLNADHGITQIIERADVEAGTYTLSWVGTATGRVYNVGASAPALAASPITVALDGLANVQVDIYASGATKTVGKVQLELGGTPSAYETPDAGTELARCQRYFWRWQSGSGTDMKLATGAQSATTRSYVAVAVPVPLRAAPAVTFLSMKWSDDVVFDATVSAIAPTYTGGPGNTGVSIVHLIVTFTSSGAVYRPGSLAGSAATSWLAFDAEL